MGATDLSLPVRVRTIAPEAVVDVQAWAERQREHLRSLQAERNGLLVSVEAAEAAAAAAGHGCPPALADAVDAMLSAALDRLDSDLTSAKREAVRQVAAALRQGNAQLSAAGRLPGLRPDSAWEDRVLATALRRPRSAVELWQSMALATTQPAEPEDDPFDRFWQGAESGRRLIRRPTEGTRS